MKNIKHMMTFESLMIESCAYALSVIEREKKNGCINKTRFYQNGRIVNEEEIKEIMSKNWEILKRNNEQ